MTRSSLSLCKRILASIQSASIVLLLLILSGIGNYLSAAALQAPARGPKIWLGDNQALPMTPVGAPTLAQSVAAGQAQPLSMATADVDGDGVADMVAGFSAPGGGAIVIHRGNVDAFAPQSDASFQAIAHGQFPAPFLPNAQIVNIPVRPDFMALGRFTPGGHQDLIVAALGGSSLYLLPGDGKGSFGAPQKIALSGGVTAMAAENLLRSLPYSNLVVGVASAQSSSLLVFSGSDAGMTSPAVFPLKAAAGNIVFGDFGDSYTDTAFLSGGNVFILHSSNFQMEALSLPLNASAMALGSFIFDRVPALQIALLTSDGTLHIAAHSEFDPRPLTGSEIQARLHAGRRGYGNPLDPPRALPQNGFKIVESIASAAPFASEQPPVLFRTRISDHGADDVMVLNPSMGQMAVISHPDLTAGATTFLPGQVSTRPYTGSPVAALPMRTNVDGRPGVVALHAGQLAPAVMMPLPDPTFTVNRTDDPVPASPITNACNGVANDCSLREAILRANATAGTDTVTVPAGTYTLTLARVQNDCTGNHGALSVEDSVNIVGAGQATTIIQAGTTNINGIDMVMNVNEDLATANCPITNATASISNLTLKFGRNHGTVATFDGDGGCMEYDTGSSGTANLVLDHVTFSDCSTTDGNGAGIAIFNASSGLPGGGTGLATITNSIFQNGSVAEVNTNAAGSGGGIWVADLARMSLSNSQILNNNANQINGTGRGVGGGLFIFSAGSGSRQTVLHSNTITGNKASGDGGGIWDTSNLLIDNAGTPTSLTVISGNTAGGNGGGIHYHAVSPDVMTLSKITITGNTATGNGGGIDSGEPTLAHAFSMSFSRLAGNTAATASNLNNNHSTATVTNNWWGTNTPATTINSINSGTTTFDPFIVLTHTASPSTIRINQSTTLTGDMSKDNHGVGTALAGNLDVIVGLPITFNNPILGTIPQAQPETLGNPVPTATATFNAGGTSGNGHADATVDQATVTANIVILEPLQITKSFSPNPVAVNASSTLTFSVNNPNVIAVDASFTDTLPAGLVVAATPGVTNTCGGTVTAVAGSGSISFSNASLPVGACTITVKVSSATDNIYSNTVTINSTAAGTGAQSTSSANLTVINPPSITKAFGAATIPLNGTTSLTFTLSSSDANLTLNGVAFTDSLPSGLVVATPGNLNSTCSGTATAPDGSSSISLSGASLAPGASCTVSVNIAGTTAGVKSNSVQVSSTNGGTGNTSNASITVVAPPVIIKAFGAISIALNGSTSLQFTVQNNNATVSLSGVAFSDTLPAGLVISTPNGLTGTCGGGTITATQGTNVVSLTGATLAASTSCVFTINVTGTAAGQQNNTTGAVTSTEGGTGGTASASLNVVAPPSIAKAFNPSTIALNATTSLTFTITNPAANTVGETGVAFTDTLPTGLTVANATATVCGGTLTTTAPTGISLSGATIAINSQCQFSVTVTGTASGQYTNTTGAVSSTNGGTGNTASANLTVASPPTITKVFGVSTIPLNGTTSLTFTIQNPNTGVTLNGVAFTDTLPAGLVVASPNNLNNTCGGTATAVAGSGSVSLSGGTLAASASCTVSVNVQGTTAGVKNNSVQVTSTEGGTGNTSTTSITVVGPPTISKAFNPAVSIPLNGTATLTFTISNPNASNDLSGVAFSDTLPSSTGMLVVASPPNVSNTCGGTVTATAGTGVISLSGGSVVHAGSCTLSVAVQGTAAGDASNTTGAITSTEGGTGATSNTALLKVVAPPSIAKVFNPTTIPLNGTTSLTFTITNPAANTAALAGVAFTDTLPTGLTVANATATVCGGTLTTTAPTGISLSGATIAINSQCQFSVTVTGTASGQYTNTTGAVSSTNGGTGNTASANLTVASPPTMTKAFTLHQIPLNGTTTLTFSITNPNTNVTLTGIAFTDNFPSGIVVGPTPGVSNTCGGTVTAIAGAGSASLSGGTLAASASCAISLTIQGTTAGIKSNSVQVTSTEGGTGNVATDSITVVAPPVIIKAFGAASIPLNGTTSLQFTIQNNNPVALSGIGFSDTLPAGLVISTPNGQSGSCGGGTITATQATSVISLSGATLAQSTSCTFSVNVTGTAAGQQNNTTGQVTSTEGGTGGTASASINVVAPPQIAKGFNPGGIQPNGVSTLTITITNPGVNATAETGVAFTDSLPVNVVVATPNGLTNTCGGTATATAGSGSLSLTGGTVAANSSCTVTVNVTSSFTGTYLNTTGAVSSTNGGTGGTASATLVVANPPTISKLFLPDTTPVNVPVLVSFTITNPNSNSTPPSNDVTLTGISFTDALPAGLVVASPSNASTDCGGTLTAVSGSGTISLTGGTVAPAVGLRPGRRARTTIGPAVATGQCFVSVSVVASAVGTYNNTTGPISANESGPGATSNTATLTVTLAPPSIAKAFSPNVIGVGGTSTLNFTISNPNTGGSSTLTGIAFTDTLPVNIVVATPNGAVGSCNGGTLTAVAGSGSISLTGGSIPGGSSCVVSVNVTSSVTGSYANTTGNVTSANGGTGNTATAILTVQAANLSITKTHQGTFQRGQTGANWIITVSDSASAGPTGGTVTVVDTLPSVTHPPVPRAMSGTGWTCTLATLTCTRSDALAPGASYPAITLTVNIPQNIVNHFTNTATVSGGGDPNSHQATDSITLGPPILITSMDSGSATVARGGAATFQFQVDTTGVPTLPVVVSFTCSGAPAGTACIFTPLAAGYSTTNPISQMTMTVTSLGHSASLKNRGGMPPTFAALLFPIAGLVGVGFGFAGRKRKQLRFRLAMMLMGLMLLAALAGCGGNALMTPTGQSTITVTGTAATAAGPVSGSTTVTLTVQ